MSREVTAFSAVVPAAPAAAPLMSPLIMGLGVPLTADINQPGTGVAGFAPECPG